MSTRPDARPDQLILLKLENRTMRPLATTLLSDAPTAAKRAAIAGAALAIASIAGAPAAYAMKLGVSEDAVAPCAASFAEADHACAQLLDMVTAKAEPSRLVEGLHALYRVIDSAHAYLNDLALAQGARLLDDDQKVGGTGGEDKLPPLSSWLTQFSLRAR